MATVTFNNGDLIVFAGVHVSFGSNGQTPVWQPIGNRSDAQETLPRTLNAAAFVSNAGNGPLRNWALPATSYHFKISQTGLITVDTNVPVGDFTIIVRVENDEGASTQQFVWSIYSLAPEDEEDQYFLPPEGTDARFRWMPSRNYTRRTNPRVKIARFGDGYEQRIPDGIHSRDDTWNLAFKNRTIVEVNQICEFLRDKEGFIGFYWEEPGTGNLIKVKCSKWNKNTIVADNNYGFGTVTATFQRVYD